MQILVSDYDGTLNPFYFKPLFSKNIKGIKEYRANNNLFVISTARKPKQIIKELKWFSIPYDYLICSNGKIILDNNGDIIYTNIIYEHEIRELLSTINILFGIKSLNYLDIYGNITNQAAYKILIEKNNLKKLKKISNLISGIKVNAFFKKISISHYSDKRKGLIALLKELKIEIDSKNIYSIGNSLNDIKMLKSFNGYKVPHSNPHLLLNSEIPMINSVYTLTRKIQHYND